MKIGFAGMTHLGLISAVGAAEKGFSVVAFDQDEKKKKISEPHLDELLEKNKSRIHFTADMHALISCELIYVAPDIPTDDAGNSDLAPLVKLLDMIIPQLTSQILVILSQVPPGFTRKISYPHTFYQVETLIFGQAIERTLHPERFIIGTNQSLPPLYQKYLSSYHCPIFSMRFESAELAKIAINLFLVSSVSTTNMIADLCEKIGADWGEIVPTLQLDKRIGPHAYLQPGLGLAGGNLERDLKTFSKLAAKEGCDATLVQTWQKFSQRKRDWVLTQIHRHVLQEYSNPRFAILGLAYKKDTASLKNSPSLELIANLQGFAIKAFDPVVNTLPDYYPTLELAQSAELACEEADVVIVMTPWDSFKELAIRGKILIDPYHVIQRHPACDYYTLGVTYETHLS